jgi:hypothetical protein
LIREKKLILHHLCPEKRLFYLKRQDFQKIFCRLEKKSYFCKSKRSIALASKPNHGERCIFLMLNFQFLIDA